MLERSVGGWGVGILSMSGYDVCVEGGGGGDAIHTGYYERRLAQRLW